MRVSSGPILQDSMHSNDTGVFAEFIGKTDWFNIQVPVAGKLSPAYKNVKFSIGRLIQIETEILDSVSRMEWVFSISYQMEWNKNTGLTKGERGTRRFWPPKANLKYTGLSF